MSRVGKKPIPVPGKTKITYKDRVITVQGEKGTLTRTVNPNVDLEIEKDIINHMNFTRYSEEYGRNANLGLRYQF